MIVLFCALAFSLSQNPTIDMIKTYTKDEIKKLSANLNEKKRIIALALNKSQENVEGLKQVFTELIHNISTRVQHDLEKFIPEIEEVEYVFIVDDEQEHPEIIIFGKEGVITKQIVNLEKKLSKKLDKTLRGFDNTIIRVSREFSRSIKKIQQTAKKEARKTKANLKNAGKKIEKKVRSVTNKIKGGKKIKEGEQNKKSDDL